MIDRRALIGGLLAAPAAVDAQSLRLGRSPGFRAGLKFLGGVVPPVGFYSNGSSNAALKAAFARVMGGTGNATGLIVGDSLQVAIGGGTTADSARITGAAPNRPASVLASLYTQAGVRMFDNGFVNDGGLQDNGITLSAYDPRVILGTPPWSGPLDRTFAGGGHLDNAASISGLTLTPTTPTDTCEILIYNAGVAHIITSIDGSQAAGVYASGSATQITTPSSIGGFTQLTIKAASVGMHAYAIASDSAAAAAKVCRMTAYNSTLSAVNLIVAAAGSSNTTDLSTSGNDFRNLDHLEYVAPDFTIIEALTNDMNMGVPVATSMSNLKIIFDAAKLFGSVLMIFPTPTSLVSDATLQSFNAATKQLCIQEGVPLLSLYEYYGPFTSAFGARTNDGTHPLAPLYAEIAGLIKQAIDLMRAA